MASISISARKVINSKIEFFLLPFLFFISFYSSRFLIVSLVFIGLFLSKQQHVGAIKLISILTFRTFINHGLAVEIETISNLKWLFLLIASVYLLSGYFHLEEQKMKKINKVMFGVSLFFISNIITSLLFSSLPVVSIFKLASYVLIFTGILVGVAFTSEYFDLVDWLIKCFKLLMVNSFVLLFYPVGFLVNGWSFQGVFNHPNMFGILSVLFISLILFKKENTKLYFNDVLFFFITFFMLVESNSRTSLLAGSVLLIYFFVSNYFRKITNLKIIVFCLSIIFLIFFFRPMTDFLVEYFSKGQSFNNLLFSREQQLNQLISNFKNSPLFGNGFGVPVLDFKNYIFSMNYVVEPGNLIFAVLSYSGVIGFLLFVIYMFQILFSNKYNMFYNPYLFLAPLLISMGEMVFFSSNSIGTFCYMLLAIHVFYKPKIES